jgi:hypothetical protein
VSDFFDPPPIDTGPLGDLASALERATDAYARACNDAAVAENGYLRAFHLAWVSAQGVAQTVKAKHCDNQAEVVEARCEHNLAVAREKSARAKCEELKNRLMATMSWQRTVGAQT